MQSKLIYILLIATALLLSACNNDVFVDHPDMGDDENIILQSPFDNSTHYFKPSDIDRISVYHSEMCRHVLITPEGVVKTDEEGHEVEVNPAEGGKVDIMGPACQLTVDVDSRGVITIANSENYSRIPFTAKVLLFNGEMYRTIKVEVQPGRQFNVQFTIIDTDKQAQMQFRERVEGVMTYNNNTDSEQVIAIKPYQGAMTNAMILFSDNCDKMLNLKEAPEMELVTASPDSMLHYDGRKLALTPELQRLPLLDAGREVRYRLPAHTKVRFTRTLLYVKLNVPFIIYATHPEYESEQYEFHASLGVIDPIDFKLEYEIVE